MDNFNDDRERERTKRLSQLFEGKLSEYLSDGYDGVVIHSASIIVAVDDGILEMTGYSREELLFQNALTFFPSNSGKQVMQQMLTLSSEAYTVTATHKDGTVFQVQLKGMDFEIQGEPVRAVQARRIK